MDSDTSRQNLYPLIYFPGKTSFEKRRLATLKRSRLVIYVAPKIYVASHVQDIPELIRSSWVEIVSNLYPEVLLSHISALSFSPTSRGDVYLTSTTNRTIQLPGINLNFVRGHAPLASDSKYCGIFSSSFERALLENLSLGKDSNNKSTGELDIAERLSIHFSTNGHNSILVLLAEAKRISEALEMTREYLRLSQIANKILNAGDAREKDIPSDYKTYAEMCSLFSFLRFHPTPTPPLAVANDLQIKNRAILSAYHLLQSETPDLPIKALPPAADDWDISSNFELKTRYEIMVGIIALRQPFTSFLEFRNKLKSFHMKLFSLQLGKLAGTFRSAHEPFNSMLVEGSLQKGFSLYRSLPKGLASAFFLSRLINAVSPFEFGNQEISKLVINSELAAAGIMSAVSLSPLFFEVSDPSTALDILARDLLASDIDYSTLASAASEHRKKSL